MSTRLRTWRLARAERALADAEHHFKAWVEPFARRLGTVSPSRMAAERRKLDRLKARVARLEGR